MSDAIGSLGTPNANFLVLVVIGGLAGWLAATMVGTRETLFADILFGVAGAWLGAQFADLSGAAAVGSLGHFLAALIGSIITVAIWRRVDRETKGVGR